MLYLCLALIHRQVFKLFGFALFFMNFQILHQTKKSRLALLKTLHGTIHTPNFIPVATQATVKSLSSLQLAELHLDALLCNTYHLYLRPGEKTIKKLGGLHEFMHWKKPLFTDSGGFQVFSLKDCQVDEDKVCFKSHIDSSLHHFTPEKSIRIQEDLGADIIFTFDECLPFESSYSQTKRAMERTHHWALRCLSSFKNRKKQSLFGIIQGGKFKSLRKQSARFISSLDFPGYGLGSFFHVKKEGLQALRWALEELPEDKPRHLLGIGSIDDIFNSVELGIDTFDCVLPTRLARVGYIFIHPPAGSLKNKFRYRITNSAFKEDKKPLDKNCGCPVCQNYSRAYLRHLFKAGELSAYSLATCHNLYFFNRLMQDIRDSIKENQFPELKKRWLK